jgi:hypothetical protein
VKIVKTSCQERTARSSCFAAIRNPVGHLPNDQVELTEQSALERLAALSLLARWVDEAEVESA